MKHSIIASLIIGGIIVSGFMSCTSAAETSHIPAVSFSESDGIFAHRVGQFEVFMLVEAQREGNTGIIPGASDEILERYIPADGFNHSTNVFVVKTSDQIIVVDTGFGNTIFEKMELLGILPEQVDAVLLTHMHGDHFGGLQKDSHPLFPNAKVYLDSRDREHFTVIAPNQGAADALAAYGENVETFDADVLGSTYREILPGVSALANYGHTPGHTVYLIANGGDRLIIAGDFLHVALVQFPHPEISATFDVDQSAAAVSRRQILEYAATNNIPIGGMHIVYPGMGDVEADGEGFKFIPKR
ncbi:MAG: MBL fold metallo-hydrolase [Treponema sp.]|nr:MBL fold metallo-hydrolase [Treponema sp.]